ncbi:MAG: metallophosphoesterase family protein [Gemmatimonadetes bacterium]|nr:metallophosphoesterase family protein [Gemmatimonadota bacterium]
MRIAILNDIHGNLPALEAVLEEMGADPPDHVVVGGDLAPGPMCGACLDALRALPMPVHFIVGNGDADVLSAHRGEMPERVPEPFRDVVAWVAGDLTDAQRTEMAAWPLTHRMDVPNLGSVLFCHATPRGDNEIFTELTPEERLLPVFEPLEAALVVVGHTHMQFARPVGYTWVVNAGSVGMPFGPPGAYWAMIEKGEVDLRRTKYDLDAADERIRATDYPSEFEVKSPPSDADMLSVLEGHAL